MENQIKKAIDKLEQMKWITINKNLNREVIYIEIEDFIKKTPLNEFMGWFLRLK